ncbi:hypothetical protein HY990_04600 [Candidatus Micrarchaeota archaeon]|nr:hypothetical protein [Candidatus Micrarchaeota archaeon]
MKSLTQRVHNRSSAQNATMPLNSGPSSFMDPAAKQKQIREWGEAARTGDRAALSELTAFAKCRGPNPFEDIGTEEGLKRMAMEELRTCGKAGQRALAIVALRPKSIELQLDALSHITDPEFRIPLLAILTWEGFTYHRYARSELSKKVLASEITDTVILAYVATSDWAAESIRTSARWQLEQINQNNSVI